MSIHRIGLVSSEEHCKPHAEALRKAGFKVDILGGDPGLVLPTRCDAFIVRVCSISHAAFDVVNEEKRKGSRPVWFLKGVAHVRKLAQEIKTMSLRHTIRTLVEANGWFHPTLLQIPYAQVMERKYLLTHNTYKSLKKANRSSLSATVAGLWQNTEGPRSGPNSVYVRIQQHETTAGGRPRVVWALRSLLSQDTETLITHLDSIGMLNRVYSSPQEPGHLEAPKWAPLTSLTRVWTVPSSVAEPPPPPAPKPRKVKAPPAPKPKPPVAIPAPAPAPEVPIVAPPLHRVHEDVQTALALLLGTMVAHGVQEITLSADGVFHAQQEIVTYVSLHAHVVAV
jgi:hypothetical protein